IAKVAAKLAVGYTLDELQSEITGVTPASFEPTIDYVVTKMPRFTFEKFPGAAPLLTTSMKSVGEAMAIGRNFAESVQKALRSLETGLDGFDEVAIDGGGSGGEGVGAGGRARRRGGWKRGWRRGRGRCRPVWCCSRRPMGPAPTPPKSTPPAASSRGF